MDPLSQVLSLLKPRTYRCGGLDVGGELSFQFPRHEGIKCYAVVSGQGWLSVEGVPEPVRLESGDCMLLPSGRPFSIASSLTAPRVDAVALFAKRRNGAIDVLNGGGNCMIVGGHFSFAGDHAGFLLGVLPPIVHLRREPEKAALRWALESMMRELREPQPGSFLVLEHLAHMMLVQALRLYLSEGVKDGSGWLLALADRQMSAAIEAMHESPAHRWTVEELAARVGMSRSIFAAKFKETVGDSPMEYLTRWRMLLAEEKLAHSSDSVSAIALSLGYTSQSAFTKAFRRTMGRAPRRHGRSAAGASPMPMGDKESDIEIGHGALANTLPA